MSIETFEPFFEFTSIDGYTGKSIHTFTYYTNGYDIYLKNYQPITDNEFIKLYPRTDSWRAKGVFAQDALHILRNRRHNDIPKLSLQYITNGN